MSRSRQLSTEEKEALVRRMEAGERIGALATETGVLRKSLYQWRAAWRAMGAAGLNRKRGPKPGGRARSIRRRPTPALPPRARPTILPRPRRASASSSAWSDANRRTSIFFAKPCGHGTPSAAGAARPSLRRHRKNDARRTARRNESARRPDRASLLDRLAVAGKLLSLARTEALGARRCGPARSDPEIGAQAPSRRLSAHHAKAQGRRPRGQRQARAQAHAGRQFVEPAQAPVRPADHDEPASLPDRAQSRARARSHRPRSAVGRRHHPRAKPEDRLYVRLAETFVYLAVVIDAFSRRVVGWALDDHLEARLAVDALDQAIAARDSPPGLIHHSDRGVQYASSEYAARLDGRGFQRSMSRPGNPYDNAKAESFMKTLKAEEADGTAYADLKDARGRIGAFIEDVYNADRLHSALGYKSPVAFEAAIRNTADRNQQPPDRLVTELACLNEGVQSIGLGIPSARLGIRSGRAGREPTPASPFGPGGSEPAQRLEKAQFTEDLGFCFPCLDFPSPASRRRRYSATPRNPVNNNVNSTFRECLKLGWGRGR